MPLAGLLWFCLLSGSYGVIFWLPQVLRALTGFDLLTIGIIGALPWVGVALGMYFNATSFRPHRRTGVAHRAPALLAAVALTSPGTPVRGAAGLAALIARGSGSRRRAGRVLGAAGDRI